MLCSYIMVFLSSNRNQTMIIVRKQIISQPGHVWYSSISSIISTSVWTVQHKNKLYATFQTVQYKSLYIYWKIPKQTEVGMKWTESDLRDCRNHVQLSNTIVPHYTVESDIVDLFIIYLMLYKFPWKDLYTV